MTNKKDFIELGEWQLNAFKQRDKYKQALEEIRNILCNGRTFYEGYFDTPILSRTDKAIKVINEVLEDSEKNDN